MSNNFSMTVPGATSNKRDDVKNLEAGPNVGILYQIIDLGTHYNENFKKSNRWIRFTFEFPLFKQLFRTDDTEPRSTVVSVEHTFQIAERSNLKKFVDGALGRVLQKHEYENGYDIGQFLGKAMICTIANKPSSKGDKVYSNITAVQAITEHVRNTYAFDWNQVVRTNDLIGFMIDPQGQCFQSETFANFPSFIRDKILKSDEAVAYVQNGGYVIPQAEYKPEEHKVQTIPQGAQQPVQRQPVSQQPAPPPQGNAENVVVAPDGRQLIWLDNNYDLNAYLGQNWSVDALIADGKCKLKPQAPTPPPPAPPVSNVPAGPPAPPVQPQAPQPMQPVQPASDFDADVDDVPF